MMRTSPILAEPKREKGPVSPPALAGGLQSEAEADARSDDDGIEVNPHGLGADRRGTERRGRVHVDIFDVEVQEGALADIHVDTGLACIAEAVGHMDTGRADRRFEALRSLLVPEDRIVDAGTHI